MVKAYDIVIIPGQEVADSAREVSAFLRTQTKTCFSLGTTENFPHISLYHFSAEEYSLEDIQKTLQEVTNSLRSFFVKQPHYGLVGNYWVDVSYEKDEPLAVLHQTVLDSVAPFREKSIEHKEEWSDDSQERQENLKLYGWSEAGSLYRPHLTLTRLVDMSDESVLDTLPLKNYSFSAKKLGLYELGEYGTCKKLIAEFTLTD
jgi:2'-5' RNA ligase